ncbi:MAG: SPFH domain-containing protein [Phycisphaerales bacterium]
MIIDHQTYRRATSISLFGVFTQLVLGVALLVYGNLGGDSAAITGSIAILLGVPIWICLTLVYNQHKLERIEALERESLAGSSAGGASVFEDLADDQSVQKARLNWMHRWFLPGVSLVLAAAAISLGIFAMLRANAASADPESLPALPREHGWAIALSVGIACIGFVFARFVSGMAKVGAWSMLRAGAAASVSAAVVSALVLVAHFLQIGLGIDAMQRAMPVIMSIYLIVIGVEIVLNFVLNLYKPRRAGEYIRPAFDSRILAFVAAPDRLAESVTGALSYQFGFDVGSTWFYKLVSRSFAGLVLLGALVVWGMTSISVVRPDEKGLLLVNGALRAELDSGPVVKMPWPFSSVLKFPAYSVNRLHVGSPEPTDPRQPVLWTEAHAGRESYLLVRSSTEERARDGNMDFSLIAAEFPIHFTVEDLVRYQLLAQDSSAPRDPDKVRRDLLESIASSVVMEHIATYTVEQLLGPERKEIADRLQRLIQNEFDSIQLPFSAGVGGEASGAGVRVLFVGVAGVHPPTDVAPAFESVISADALREANLQRAEAHRIQTLGTVVGDVRRAEQIVAALDELRSMESVPSGERSAAQQDAIEQQRDRIARMIEEAGGRAAIMLAEARRDRWATAQSAKVQAIRSRGLSAAYRAAPTFFRAQRILAAFRDAAEGARIWITPFEDPQITIDAVEQQIDTSGWGTPEELDPQNLGSGG